MLALCLVLLAMYLLCWHNLTTEPVKPLQGLNKDAYIWYQTAANDYLDLCCESCLRLCLCH